MKGFELRDLELDMFPDLERRSLGTEEFAGRTVHPLEVDTVIEHLERHGDSYERIGNRLDGPQVKADLGSGYYLDLLNREGEAGGTEIKVASEAGYGSDTVYDSRFRALVQREKKAREASEWAVDMMEDEGEDVWQVFKHHLDGRDFDEVAEDNFMSGKSFDSVTLPYSFLFELKPGQDIDSDRVTEYRGEIPNAEYQEEVEKYHYWFTKYLSNIAQEAAHRSGEIDSDVRERWLKDSPEACNPA